MIAKLPGNPDATIRAINTWIGFCDVRLCLHHFLGVTPAAYARELDVTSALLATGAVLVLDNAVIGPH